MLLIGNGRLITRGAHNRLIENGCVAADGNVIAAVGTTEELKKRYPGAEFIDARGGMILPGLINAHNHIYSAYSRGIAINGYNPQNFLDILDGMWWTIDRNLLLEDTRMSALTTYIDCIKNGVTTVFDHHASYGEIPGSLFAIADAAKETGVRTCLCYEVSDRDGAEKMRQAVKENADFIAFCKKDKTDMVKGMMGLHASFTLSDATLALCRENTPADAGFHIHVAEGMTDVYDSLKKYGKRVINRLFDNDILGEKTITGHCIHVNGTEMDILKETNTMVVHNPESNMGNAVGCPPTMEMIHRGLTVGLGTDGYTNDMYESMKAANCLHKHNLCDPTAAWSEVPYMLFEGNPAIGARFFEKKLGALEPGAAADIIVTDYDPLTPLSADNVNGHTLFGMSGRQTVTTVIDGKVRMKDRELVGIDEREVLAKSREQAEKMWARINAR
ncbi:putative aminohydrolase SsnA [Anaerotruncus massiliensis (ex Liu et al. 2021)]|uniref:Aminohydrolase SsnA n=2 Tax=Anaerotruncus TaxID=244127 RepID=A0ABR7ACQ2_9FIRM|nr:MULTISPECIES: putative aminohydrolase SsnA [Anaerotruncus]MBC3938223.1 putative aminohydrolase SsnA [Anaerotruncus massiliensis (ex Togo et al. 2019)]RLL12727.1 putative aminohydrolase SsnA [Anaerotruncus massiliensis (ex Liu et al. 2021)]